MPFSARFHMLWSPAQAGRLPLLVALLALTAAAMPSVALAGEPVGIEVDEKVQTALERSLPRSLDELKLIEDQCEKVTAAVMPTLVHVIVDGRVRGSGVVISEDGFVLTAGHVNGRADRRVSFVFTDGTRVRGKTLGVHSGIDAGLMKITDEGPWPYASMAEPGAPEAGTWCLALGHPNGFDADRPCVTRLGRVIRANAGVIQTDATIVSGDSGGPLYDMTGRVIGIHSRINPSMLGNYHVPIWAYTVNWDRLAEGEVWGGPLGGGGRETNRAFLGVTGEDVDGGLRVTRVVEGSAAARARLQVGDVITKVDSRSVGGLNGLIAALSGKKPDDQITLQFNRGEQTLRMKVTLGERP